MADGIPRQGRAAVHAARRCLPRRRLLGTMGAVPMAMTVLASAAAQDTSWTAFKARFVDADGRVLDTGNKSVSHSEGQGWGLLFAESHGDRPVFEQLWSWTSHTLRRPDNLFSWRWVPWGTNHVPDPNNASDGDILIAWALMRAARRWQAPQLEAASRTIRQAILHRVLADLGTYLVLLPGADGFQRGGRRIVNLSYYVWPALRDFASGAVEPARWLKLEQDGLRVLDLARFGALKLPPDWALVGRNNDVGIADDWPPRFGYDAIRIPLYLAWAGHRGPLGRFVEAWRSARVGNRPPAWIDLRSGAVADYVASGGYEAVERLTAAMAGGTPIGEATMPSLEAVDDYYAASLKMLARVAVRDAVR